MVKRVWAGLVRGAEEVSEFGAGFRVKVDIILQKSTFELAVDVFSQTISYLINEMRSTDKPYFYIYILS